MKCHNTLDVVIRPQPVKSNKVKAACEIAIFLGPVLVASKIVGGNWTQEQALSEFRRNPHTFNKYTGFESAQALKLVA